MHSTLGEKGRIVTVLGETEPFEVAASDKKISDERIEDEFGQNVNTESSNI